MAHFWDLPKPVREQIYRLHLVKDEEVDHRKHGDLSSPGLARRGYNIKEVPPLLLISSKADREAAPIYYGENHFVFGRRKGNRHSCLIHFARVSWTRHIRLIRKLTVEYPEAQTGGRYWGGYSNEAGPGMVLPELVRFRGLQELYIRVDEVAMIRSALRSRRTLQSLPPRQLTAQDGVALLRHPGMSSLLKMSGIPHVEFLKKIKEGGGEEGGAISGGFLETEILPKLQAQKKKKAVGKRSKNAFDILALPAELRNRIYGLILKLNGPIHPSTEAPSSLPKGRQPTRQPAPRGSALNILVANRQIYDEAYGIFYAANTFEFYYPVQVLHFTLGISHDRIRQIQTMTIHYHDANSGGVSLAALSFQALKQFSGLRSLHILFVRAGLKDRLALGRWRQAPYGLRNANPLDLPGMQKLFELRGIKDVLVRDTEFEDEIKEIKKDRRSPDRFVRGDKEDVYLKFERVLAHMNLALAAAQYGRHNKELLENDEWHMEDEFPAAEREVEEIVKAEDDMQGQQRGDETEVEEVTVPDDKPIENIRDRLRSSTRRKEIEIENRDQDEIAVGPAGTGGGDENGDEFVMSGGLGLKDEAADQDEAADAVYADEDMEDEIVVRHVARPAKATPAGMIGGLDGASDEPDLDDSYANRERSVELGGAGDEADEEGLEDSYAEREPSVEL